MHQNLSTLNLSHRKLAQLTEQGKIYISDLRDSEAKFLAEKSTNSTSISALSLLESELTCRSILTFKNELDTVLEDEILPGKITELTGLPGSGKTQICFQLCVSTQIPQFLGGLGGQVIYMNTKKNFSPRRIRQICQHFKTHLGTHTNSQIELLNEDNILTNIFLFNILEVTEMWAAVNLLERFLVGKNIKLVIIDSITHPLKYLTDPLERVPTMYKFLGKLQQLSTAFQFAMVVTNDFTPKIKNNEMYFAPAFGDSLCDRVNSRICLSKCEHFYVAQLVKSVTKSPMSAKFLITC